MTAPNALELLLAARASLLDELLPALPADLHYSCRMIASALAIAVREIEQGEQVDHLESQLLDRVLAPEGLAGRPHDEALAHLARLVRQGAFDAQEVLPEVLSTITRARLSISNPKVLRHER
tara:strand:+ start:21193 stop:21558 length:366 start_codon:yes stop_codon:yes gene_type:complete